MGVNAWDTLHPVYEEPETPAQIAHRFGVSEEYVRANCAREENPIPHLEMGTGSRHHYRIKPSRYLKWEIDEMYRTAYAK